MANYRLVAPVIRWGATLQNAVYFPFPLDSVFSGSEPRAGSEATQAPSGVEAAWRFGTDYVLAGMHRWLAQSDTLFYPRCTGWDGALGVRAALETLQTKSQFNWHPDGRNIVTAPLMSADANADGVVDDFTKSGVAAGLTFVFDAGQSAQRLDIANTLASGFYWVEQTIPVIVGEQLTFSAEYKVSGSCVARLIIQALDGGGAGVDGGSAIDSLTAGAFTRVSPTTYTVPVGVVTLKIFLEAHVTLGQSGSVWWRKAMVRRDSTDPTFVDNPRITGCYLVDPIQFTPANETDGSRQLTMKIRNPTTPYDGY